MYTVQEDVPDDVRQRLEQAWGPLQAAVRQLQREMWTHLGPLLKDPRIQIHYSVEMDTAQLRVSVSRSVPH